MKRKVLATLITTVLAFSLFPVTAASAAVSSTARLTQGIDVLPGTNDYAIQITNNNSSLPGVLAGTAANHIQIIKPPNVLSPQCPATPPSGWTCKQTSLDLVFRGGSLAPGGSLTIPFKATTNRPLNKDVATTFVVHLSDDNGKTGSRSQAPAGGTLTSMVRILEVLPNGIQAMSPLGAADGNGTAGQPVSFRVPVRNHAQQAVMVTAALTSNGADTIGSSGSLEVPAGGNRPFMFPVTLRSTSGDVTGTFTGSATAPDSSARPQSNTYVIQAAPRIVPVNGSLRPRDVRSNAPLTYSFELDYTKTGTPAISNLTGSLSFACTNVPVASPTGVAAGPQSSATMKFAPKTICGDHGSYTPALNFAGMDSNDFAYSQSLSLTDTLNIDNIAPVVSNVRAALPSGQTATKNNDSITVSGNIDESTAVLDSVILQVAGGKSIDITDSCSRSATGFTCTQQITDWGVAFGQFTAFANASDRAGNSGGGASDSYLIDTVAPDLVDPGSVVVEPRFGTNPVIQVQFADDTTVSGGCMASNWSVGGNLVTRVYTNDGVDQTNVPGCVSSDNSNIRYIRTALAIGRDDEPQVEYSTSQLGGNARDEAAANAAEKVIATLNQIAPGIPEIIQVFRNNGTEVATSDEGKRWTRFGGDDTIATIGGANPGYTIQVLDANNNVLRSTPVTGDTASTVVPIGNTEGDYLRKIRLLNRNNVAGDVAELTIALDQTLPLVTGSEEVSEDNIVVNFNDVIWGGTPFKENWIATETNLSPAPGDTSYYGYAVDFVSEDTGPTRDLVSDMDDNGPFRAAEYMMTDNPENVRYEDRAGNQLADTWSY